MGEPYLLGLTDSHLRAGTEYLVLLTPPALQQAG